VPCPIRPATRPRGDRKKSRAALIAGAGIGRGRIYGESDQTGSSPRTDPVHPTDLLATVYHAFGIDPATMMYNHLNQLRELVKDSPVTALFA